MSGKPSKATLKALKLVEKGVPPYRAALRCRVQPSTIYRALAKLRKK